MGRLIRAEAAEEGETESNASLTYFTHRVDAMTDSVHALHAIDDAVHSCTDYHYRQKTPRTRSQGS